MDSRKYQLFKTELCRNWQEMGVCRYAKKCRFAHGQEELRCVQRHAKYKTEICKTFHLTGTCLYGVRCTFIHDEHVTSSQTISFGSSSPLFTPSQSSTASNNSQLSLFGDADFTTWKPSPFTKLDSTSSIWAASFDRRYSSSSSSSSSSFPAMPLSTGPFNYY